LLNPSSKEVHSSSEPHGVVTPPSSGVSSPFEMGKQQQISFMPVCFSSTDPPKTSSPSSPSLHAQHLVLSPSATGSKMTINTKAKDKDSSPSGGSHHLSSSGLPSNSTSPAVGLTPVPLSMEGISPSVRVTALHEVASVSSLHNLEHKILTRYKKNKKGRRLIGGKKKWAEKRKKKLNAKEKEENRLSSDDNVQCITNVSMPKAVHVTDYVVGLKTRPHSILSPAHMSVGGEGGGNAANNSKSNNNNNIKNNNSGNNSSNNNNNNSGGGKGVNNNDGNINDINGDISSNNESCDISLPKIKNNDEILVVDADIREKKNVKVGVENKFKKNMNEDEVETGEEEEEEKEGDKEEDEEEKEGDKEDKDPPLDPLVIHKHEHLKKVTLVQMAEIIMDDDEERCAKKINK
jgi:hypothetical protein